MCKSSVVAVSLLGKKGAVVHSRARMRYKARLELGIGQGSRRKLKAIVEAYRRVSGKDV